MPVSIVTNAVQVQRYTDAVYAIAVGTTTMNQVNSDITSVFGGSLDKALNFYYTASGLVATKVAADFTKNIGVVAGGTITTQHVADMTAYVLAVLRANPGNEGATLKALCNTFANATSDPVYGTAVAKFNADVDGALAYTGASDVSAGTVVASPFTLTINADTGSLFVGNSSNNTFDASGFFNAPTGTFLQTLGNNDSINGGEGTDTLNVLLNGAAVTTRPVALTSIEVINLTNTANANILDLTNATNVTTLNSVNSTTNIAQFDNVQSAPTNFGLTNTALGLTANILNTALAGTTNEATLTLSGVTAGTVTLQPITAASGYETFNVVSNGSTANVLTALTGGLGTSLARINVSGTAGVNLGTTLDATVLTVNASTASGAVTVTQTNANAFSYTGGSGVDTIIMGAAYGTTDTINGGDGTADVLSITTAIAEAIAATQTNVTNVEQLTISNAQAGAINTTFFTSVTRINLALAAGSNTVITIDSGDDVRFQTTTTATPDLAITGIGTTDTATVTLSSAVNLAADALTTTGIETLTMTSLGLAGTTNTIFQLAMTNTAASEAVVLTGAANMTFTNTTADSVNASALTGALVQSNATVAAGGGGVTITGGTGADTLFGSTGSDIINGNAGNDNIRGDAGLDIIDLGAGDDIINLSNLSAGAAMLVSADRDNVSNFTANGTAFTAGNGVDRIDLGNVLTTLDISAGGTVANYQVQAAAGSSTLTNAQGFLELSFEFSSGVNLNSGAVGALNGTLLLSALGAATGTTAGTITVGTNDFDAIIIAYQGGRAFVYTAANADGNTGIVAAEIGLMGVYENVPVGGFVFSQFI